MSTASDGTGDGPGARDGGRVVERFISAVNVLLRERRKVLIGVFLVCLLFPVWKTDPVKVGDDIAYFGREVGFILLPPNYGEIDPVYYGVLAAVLVCAYFLIPTRLSESAEKGVRMLIAGCAALTAPPPPVRSQVIEKRPAPPPPPKRDMKRLPAPSTGLLAGGIASLQRNGLPKAALTFILGMMWGGASGSLGFSLPYALSEAGNVFAGPLGAWLLGVVFLCANYVLAHFAVEMALARETRARLIALVWGCVVLGVLVAGVGVAFFLVGGGSDDGGTQYDLVYEPLPEGYVVPSQRAEAVRWEKMPDDYVPNFAPVEGDASNPNNADMNTDLLGPTQTTATETPHPTIDWALELAASDTKAFVDGGKEYVENVRRKWDTIIEWYGPSNTEKEIAGAVATIMTARERYPSLTRANALDYLNAVARASKTFDASADADQAVSLLNIAPIGVMQFIPRAEDLVVPVRPRDKVQQPIPETPPPRKRPSTNVDSYPGTGAGHWVEENIDSGEFILLEDDSLWEIDRFDKIDATLWLRLDNITVVESSEGSLGFDYLLINTDDGESAHAKYLGRK